MDAKKLKQVLSSDLEIPAEVNRRFSETLVSLGAKPIQTITHPSPPQTTRQENPTKLRLVRRAMLIAAVVFALSATAIAASSELREMVFGVRSLLLNGDEVPGFETDGKAEKGDSADNLYELNMISLQGFPDSVEYKAAAEWSEFIESYDPDNAILNLIGDKPTGLDEVYNFYGAYTQEMADKINEIAAKYGLSLFEMPFRIINSNEELFDAIGTGAFLDDTIHDISGYIFGSGTFQFDGFANFDDKEIRYQLRNSQKGVLDNVSLSLGDTEHLEEWLYETACGTIVILASSPHRSLIVADLSNVFVVIDIPWDSLSMQTLEAFADTINFSMLSRR